LTNCHVSQFHIMYYNIIYDWAALAPCEEPGWPTCWESGWVGPQPYLRDGMTSWQQTWWAMPDEGFSSEGSVQSCYGYNA